MLVINVVVLLSGVLFSIAKPIKSYEILVAARFFTGFIRYDIINILKY